jgi:hypothetical protein
VADHVYEGMAPDKLLTSKEILARFPEVAQSPPSLLEMRRLLNSPLSRSFDSEGRLEIGPFDFPYTVQAVSTVNYARVMALVSINSYAGDIQRIKNYLGFSLPEATNLFNDVKPLIKALGLFSDKSSGFTDSRFREANLFTPRADGDALASFVETTDLAMGILSGLRLNAKVVERMVPPIASIKEKPPLCDKPNAPLPVVAAPVVIDPKLFCEVTTSETTKEKLVDVACFVNLYRSYLKELFSSMPAMSGYLMSLPRCSKLSQHPWVLNPDLLANVSKKEVSDLNEADIPKFVQNCTMTFDMVLMNILATAGYVIDTSGKVSLENTSLAPHILQYIEQLIQRFDLDRNGVLGKDEAMASYSVFKKTLGDVSGYSDDTTLQGLLGYFMVYGKPPETFFEKVYFYLIFRSNSSNWKIQVDRAKLASIMGAISNAINSKNTKLIGDDPTGEAVAGKKH